MTDRLAEIAERERKATPGEWEHACHGVVLFAKRNDDKEMSPRCGINVGIEWLPSGGTLDDRKEVLSTADFIAHARADIPWLLDNTNNALAFVARVRNQYSPREVPIGAINMIEAILRGESDGSEWPQNKQEPTDASQ